MQCVFIQAHKKGWLFQQKKYYFLLRNQRVSSSIDQLLMSFKANEHKHETQFGDKESSCI